MADNPITLYSVGHSNVATEQFVALLQHYSIANVCDVRSAPYSRYNPQFSRETLQANLRAHGIGYRYMGDELGGIPDDPQLRTDDGTRADYAKIAASPAFQHGIDTLIALGTRAPTVFMCGEADYHGCHRHKLITPALIERGVVVLHILRDGGVARGEIAPHQLSMF
jgi:uncharacterized protein (DUF488 family)